MEIIKEISLLRIMIDVVAFLAALSLIIATYMFMRPIHVASIQCAHIGAHSHKMAASTVSDKMLAVQCLLLPTLFIIISEFIYDRVVTASRKSRDDKRYKLNIFNKNTINIHTFIINTYKHLGAYHAGLTIVTMLTTLAKGTVGRMRPYYITLCDPVYMLRNHSSLSELCLSRPVLYLGSDFECRSNDIGALQEAQFSFPSGHASQSFYAMVFLCLYLAARWRRFGFGYLMMLVYTLLIGNASFTALTRVADFKHFYSDIAVGTLMGVAVAFWAFYELSCKKRLFLFVTASEQDNCKRYSLLRVNGCSRSSSQEAANKELI